MFKSVLLLQQEEKERIFLDAIQSYYYSGEHTYSSMQMQAYATIL